MDLLVTCVEAGLGLDAALSRVAEEMQLAAPLLGAELQLTFLEIQAGVPRRDALPPAGRAHRRRGPASAVGGA